jgi:hypothetical protein
MNDGSAVFSWGTGQECSPCSPCDPGYIPTTACTSTTDTVCEQIVCDDLPAISGTSLTFTNGYTYPTTAVYTVTCGDDQTTMTRDCQADGSWTPAGEIYACPRSCSEARQRGATSDGVYTIVPDGQPATRVNCDMTTDDGGWTLVYKIADASNMKTTGAFQLDMLASSDGASPDVAMSGKLSDDMIRQLCTEQYRVHQWQSTPPRVYCKFGDINQYGDDVRNTNKQCSTTYSSNANYPGTDLDGTWSQGFSTWGGFTGTTILQLNYNDGRLGSHICHGCGAGDGGCTGNGGCHSIVWCRQAL